MKEKIYATNPSDICLATITVCELFKGAYKSAKKDASIFLVNELLGNHRIVTLDLKSSEIFGKDYTYLEKNGKLVKLMDLLISSIAKSNDLKLVTRDKKDFANIPGLEIEEW